MPLLFAIAGVGEALARTTGRPALLSLASVRILPQENERSRFDPSKAARELGVNFRPVAETLADEVAWFRARGMLPPAGPAGGTPLALGRCMVSPRFVRHGPAAARPGAGPAPGRLT